MSPETARPAFAPWDTRESPRVVPTDETTRRLRTFATVEARLAKSLEAWSGIIGEPHAQATLARHAKHHEWHQYLFHHALADADGASPVSDVVDDADVAAFLDAVFEPKDATETIEFLTGVYRVLIPRKITAYTYLLRAIGADAADADERWFGFILQDEHAGIRDGELLLQSLLAGDDEVQRSADRRAVLETLILKAGGLAGPQSLGGNVTKESAR